MKRLFIILALVFSLVLAGCDNNQQECATNSCYDDNKQSLIEFQLNGDEDIQLPLNGVYEEKGAMAIANYQDISDKVIINGEVNTTISGIYKLEYLITFDDKTYSRVRTVEVLKESIFNFYLLGPTSITLEYGEKYIESGYVAINNYTGENLYWDVSINGVVDTNVAGTYILTYSIDYFSNKVELQRTIVVEAYNDFDFELKNGELVQVFYGVEYTDDGISVAYDNLDRIDYTDKLSVTSNVDVNTPGIYEVTYSVTVHNIFYELTRTVEVLSDIMTFELNGDDVIYHNSEEIYVDPGATFYLNGERFLEYPYDISDVVNSFEPGTYIMGYSGTLYLGISESTMKYDFNAYRKIIIY